MSTTTTATTSSPFPPLCSFCSTPQTSDTMHLNCPCFTAVYCNTTCQKKHWKIHAKNHKKAMKKMKMKKLQTKTTSSVAPINTTVDTTIDPHEFDCGVCLNPLPDNLITTIRLICCGKCVHNTCIKPKVFQSMKKKIPEFNNVTLEDFTAAHRKGIAPFCPFCDSTYPEYNSKEQLEILKTWAIEKKKTWPTSMIGEWYSDKLLYFKTNPGTADKNTIIYYEIQQFSWYSKSAKLGSSLGMSNLGVLLVNKGKYVKARIWWIRAAACGNQHALKCLCLLDKKEGKKKRSYKNMRRKVMSPGDEYSGEMKNGKANGHGAGTYADGDSYVGEWKNGKFHGHGTYTFADGCSHVGEYKNDKFHGHGTYTHADGDSYVGEYKNDKFHGHGTYTYADGRSYVGEWKNDDKNGHGTYTFADGCRYVGEWKNGKENGHGTLTLADGSSYVGFWKNGMQYM